MMLYLFDLVGTFAFAFLGAEYALRRQLNLLGILTFGALSALGGGTIRELLLQHTPFYFHDYTYLVVIIIACSCAAATHQRLRRTREVIMALDALGIVTFAFIGAHAAAHAQLGLAAILSFAALTAFGGGILCDITASKMPQIFTSGLVIIPSLVVGICYWVLKDTLTSPLPGISLIVFAYTLQLSLRYSTRLAFLRTRLWRKKVTV